MMPRPPVGAEVSVRERLAAEADRRGVSVGDLLSEYAEEGGAQGLHQARHRLAQPTDGVMADN
jgi:hypothetical protein